MSKGIQVSNGSLHPPSEQLLEEFVTYCAQFVKIGYSTIKLYLYAVRHHYIMNGYGDECFNKPSLKLTMRGIRKVHSTPKLNRIPLTADMLHVMGACLVKGLVNPFTDALLWAAICVGFYGALRCGDFTGQEDVLCVGDISFQFDVKLNKPFVALKLRASKTDPYRQGCTLLLFGTGQFLCPYTSLQHYLNLRNNPHPNSPLFCDINGQSLSRANFLNLFQLALKAANLPTVGVSGHSLRKGFATTACAAQIEDNLIATMGRWASDCYKLYIRTPLSTVARAQAAMAHPDVCKKL